MAWDKTSYLDQGLQIEFGGSGFSGRSHFGSSPGRNQEVHVAGCSRYKEKFMVHGA